MALELFETAGQLVVEAGCDTGVAVVIVLIIIRNDAVHRIRLCGNRRLELRLVNLQMPLLILCRDADG